MPIKIAVFDHESSGKHTPMGECHTTANGLKQASASNNPFPLKHKGKDVGTIVVLKADVAGMETVTQQMAATSVSARPSPAPAAYVPGAPAYVPGAPASSRGGANFVDYIAGGCQINGTCREDDKQSSVFALVV